MNKSLWLIAAMALGLTAQAQTEPKPLQEAKEVFGDVVRINQLPTNFNYQALITEKGNVVKEKELKLKITLLKDAEHQYFVEEHNVKTSSTGLVNLLVGTGTALKGTLAGVAWDEGIFIAIEADFGAGYQSLGAPVKMMAAPYAQCALSAPVVRGTGLDKEQPIFQVQNADGFPVISVYEDAISVNVAEDAEGTRRPRGGFAVRSFQAVPMRGDQPKFEAIERLKLVDGSFQAYIDPVQDMRRPRGGFAVMTRDNSLRAGNLPKGGSDVVLMNLSQRESYFTLDKRIASSSLQVRNRCNNDEVVLAFANNGKIATGRTKDDALVEVGKNTSQNIVVTWPIEDVMATPATLFFNTFIRWRTPHVTFDGKDNISFRIKLINLEGKKRITDYLSVGYYKGKDDALVYGIFLKPDVDMHGDTEIPEGKIRISSITNPNLFKTIDFTNPYMMDTINLMADRARIKLGRDTQTRVALSCVREGYTEEYQEFLRNVDIKVEPRKADELLPNESPTNYKAMDGALVFSLNGTELTMKIVDQKKFTEALGTFTGEVEVNVPIWYKYPENFVAKVKNGGKVRKIYSPGYINLLVEK